MGQNLAQRIASLPNICQSRLWPTADRWGRPAMTKWGVFWAMGDLTRCHVLYPTGLGAHAIAIGTSTIVLNSAAGHDRYATVPSVGVCGMPWVCGSCSLFKMCVHNDLRRPLSGPRYNHATTTHRTLHGGICCPAQNGVHTALVSPKAPRALIFHWGPLVVRQGEYSKWEACYGRPLNFDRPPSTPSSGGLWVSTLPACPPGLAVQATVQSDTKLRWEAPTVPVKSAGMMPAVCRDRFTTVQPTKAKKQNWPVAQWLEQQFDRL